MGKKYSQTDKAKEEFSSPVLDYLKASANIDRSYHVTRHELAAAMGCSDRAARHELEKVANYYPVLSSSSSKGYRLGFFDAQSTDDDIKGLFDETCLAINEIQCRIDSLKARLKPLIAFKVKLSEFDCIAAMFDELFDNDSNCFETVED